MTKSVNKNSITVQQNIIAKVWQIYYVVKYYGTKIVIYSIQYFISDDISIES